MHLSVQELNKILIRIQFRIQLSFGNVLGSRIISEVNEIYSSSIIILESTSMLSFRILTRQKIIYVVLAV